MRRSRIVALGVAALGVAPSACGDAGARAVDAAPVAVIDAEPDDLIEGPCGDAQDARDYVIELEHGGLTRRAEVHAPATPESGAAVVLGFHGYTESAALQREQTGMDAEADRDGFIAVYPEGTGDPRGWNAGACCGDALDGAVDDVGFTAALIDALEERECIDRRRVFATGFSNGGFLAHRLGCELGDQIAAIAAVAATRVVADCEPVRPMPVLMIHGTADAYVPYAGNPSLDWPSVADTEATWASLDECGEPIEEYVMDEARCTTRVCADGAAVELCTITGGGHTWPGGSAPPAYGVVSDALDGSAHIWTFFEHHARE